MLEILVIKSLIPIENFGNGKRKINSQICFCNFSSNLFNFVLTVEGSRFSGNAFYNLCWIVNSIYANLPLLKYFSE